MIDTDKNVTLLRTHPSERPFNGTFRNLIFGILFGIILTLINIFLGRALWSDIFGYLICGCALSFFGWGSERLWYSIIAAMLQNPFGWLSYVLRIPFWWLGGGIAYTLGTLLSKKIGLISLYEIPVKSIFMFGGATGIIIQAIFQLRVYRLLKNVSK